MPKTEMCRNAEYFLLALISLWFYGYRFVFKNWSLAHSWVKNFVCGPWLKKFAHHWYIPMQRKQKIEKLMMRMVTTSGKGKNHNRQSKIRHISVC